MKFRTRELAQGWAEKNARGVEHKTKVLADLIAAGDWTTAAVVADYIAIEAAQAAEAAQAVADWPEKTVPRDR